MALNSLWRAVGFHGVPVHEVWPVGVDEGTECLAVTPGAGHVGDGDPGGGVGAQHQPAPLLQSLASWHPHDVTCIVTRSLDFDLGQEVEKRCDGLKSCNRARDDPLCVLSSHWLRPEETALTSGPMRGQTYLTWGQSEARQQPCLYLRSVPEAE